MGFGAAIHTDVIVSMVLILIRIHLIIGVIGDHSTSLSAGYGLDKIKTKTAQVSVCTE